MGAGASARTTSPGAGADGVEGETALLQTREALAAPDIKEHVLYIRIWCSEERSDQDDKFESYQDNFFSILGIGEVIPRRKDRLK